MTLTTTLVWVVGPLLGLAWLAFRARRKATFRRVHKAYVASTGSLIGTPFDAGHRHTRGQDAPHVCSFPQPCAHIAREDARKERHLRVMKGGAA